MATCFNCGKDKYFTLSCPELKDIGNIKEIEEAETSNKLKKKNSREKLPPRVPY